MSESSELPQAPDRLGTDAVELLQRLIRFNTVNPPGNERDAQEFIRGLLEQAGWECQFLARVPERPNLVAHLRGKEPGPTLGLISHIDTVPANPEEWTRDPWGGEIADGMIWGRGALDMKDQASAEIATCIALGREGWRPEHGDLMLVIAADEETGAHYGAQWLCREHPDAVRCDMVVNEGAGEVTYFQDRRLFTLAVGEKGVFRFKVRTHGVAGHASIPGVGDNALLKLAPALERLRAQPGRDSTRDTDLFVERLIGSAGDGPDSALAQIRERDPEFAKLLAEPMMGVTLSPTMVQAASAANVIPSEAEILVDCRVPPEMEEAEVRDRIDSVLGEGDWDIEFIDNVVGNRSDYGGPLATAIEEWVETEEPGAEVLPMVMPGFSDSHWFREAFGATVFGFCPQSAMTVNDARPLVHSADERVPVSDVELMARCFYFLAKRILGSRKEGDL